MARGRRHSDEIRAQVIAALLEGQGVSAVAEKYKISKSTVSRIKKTLSAEKLQQVGTKKKADFESLIVEALRENIRLMGVIATTIASDEQYIKSQPIESVGVFYGIIADKAFRILEAASNAIDEEGDAV